MGKRIAAYCRVSTDTSDQVNSLTNQRNFFAREIETAGHTLISIYADEGLTGTKVANRPQFLQMLHDAGIDVHTVTTLVDRRRKTHTVYDVSDRHPAFDEIWIKNTSRFARNTLSYELISLLRAKRVNIHFMSENIDTMEMSQDLLLKLMQVFDENDSKDKSTKVRWGNAESAKRNHIRSHPRIYGYTYDLQHNALHAIPEESEVIRLIFDLYCGGLGTRRIIHELNARHITTRTGRPFCKTQINRILTNEKYAGINNPLKYDTGTVFVDRHYPKPKDEYLTMPNDRIDIIVDPEVFEQAKFQREQKTSHITQRGVYTGISPYASLLRCGACGSAYHSNADRGRVYYNCSGKKQKGAAFCSAPNVPIGAMDDLIQRLQDGLYDNILVQQGLMAIQWLNNAVQHILSTIDNDVQSVIDHIDSELDALHIRLKRLYDIYELSQSPQPMLLERIADIQSQIETLNAERKAATRPNDERMAEVTQYNRLISHVISLLDVGPSTDGPRPASRDTVMANLISVIVDADPDTKYRLTPVLRFSGEITDAIGSNDWMQALDNTTVGTYNDNLTAILRSR